MSHFEYVSALFSFAVALGIAEILSAWARLLRHRERVRFDWLPIGMSGLLIVILTQFWWGFWNFRSVTDWSYVTVLVALTPVVTIVLASLMLLPAEVGERDTDLRAHYMAHRRLIFPLAAVTFLLFGATDSLVLGQPLLNLENGVRLGAIAVCGVGAISADPRVHGALVGAGYLLFAAFLAVAIEL